MYRFVLPSIMVALLSACSFSGSSDEQPSLPLTLTIPAFSDGNTIPERFTCDGEGVSPIIKIGSVPLGTQSLALVLDDVNAPSGHFVHWVLWDIAPQIMEIPEGGIPSGAMEGTTSARKAGYDPPCPVAGSGPHAYVFSLYAINSGVSLSYEATRAMLEQQMKGKVLGIAKWTGVYERMKN